MSKLTAANPSGKPGSSAWHDRAEELAAWALANMVNRLDAWGGYYQTWADEHGWTTQQMTCPRKADRGRVLLTEDVLVRHFRAASTRDVIGLHTTSPEDTCRWGAVDIDQHGDGGNDPAANLAAALAWYERLRGLGFAPLLTDSNGAGGFHLRTLFSEPSPAPVVYAFQRWLVSDHAKHGLSAAPETFPKQARLSTPYGNWLRLPGRHHTRSHWCGVWDGATWLEGAEAVAYILALTASPPSLIPQEVEAPPAVAVTVRFVPTWRPRAVRRAGRLEARVRGFIRRCCPNLAAGQGRDDIAYKFAAFLTRDLALPDEEAMPWLREWDQGNTPPKGDAALVEIMQNAKRYGRQRVGCGRD
jgi:hypothetical protein